MTVPSVEFRPADPGEWPASSLLAAMVAEMVDLYQIPPGGHVGVPLDHRELAPPGGCYLVGWEGADPVAGGGVRGIGREVAEIKRMYVRPDRRGRGLAAGLLDALEASAAAMGYRVVRLDTGARQPHARRLYERRGYRPVGNYNGNAHAAFWGEKRLDRPVPPPEP